MHCADRGLRRKWMRLLLRRHEKSSAPDRAKPGEVVRPYDDDDTCPRDPAAITVGLVGSEAHPPGQYGGGDTKKLVSNQISGGPNPHGHERVRGGPDPGHRHKGASTSWAGPGAHKW
jgi:hypothetical protein